MGISPIRHAIKGCTKRFWFMKEMNASDVFRSFLDWLTDMDELQKKSWETVIEEDARIQDFLHEFEFEKNNKKRTPIGTRLHRSRCKRRDAKDKVKLYKSITDFMKEATTRNFFKLMKKTMGELKSAEEFVYSDRVYKPRGKEGDGE